MSNKQYSTDQLIDVTSMDVIRRYLQKDPAITGVINVKDEDLGYIGDLCEGNPAFPDNLEILGDLIGSGKIQFWKMASQISIPLTGAVHCIRLEPYLLVKDLHKIFS